MSTVRKSDFVASLADKTLDVGKAQSDPRLAGAAVARADLDHDGTIKGAAEAGALFREVDRFDHDGNAASVTNAGAVAAMLEAIKALAQSPGGAPVFKDTALSRAFPAGLGAPVVVGARGPHVVALQYTLGRLGFLADLADGAFGARTKAAVTAFQAQAGVTATGQVDAATLRALDTAVTSTDLRVPAARATDPMAHLSDFNARGLTRITVRDHAQPVTWKHPEIQAAYGRFVGEYWSVLKENRVECDCKTLALFFMDQFRKKVLADTGSQLPLPRTARGAVPTSSWTTMTAARPGGLFSRFETLPTIRAGYSAAVEVQKLDRQHSMIYGVNVRYAGINADGVSRAATEVGPWNPARDNGGDRAGVEVDVSALAVGDLVFIDHTGDGLYDHTVNIVGVEKDAQGRVKTLKLGVGSFDDMKDADGATAPDGLKEVNNYVEEVTVSLDSAGRVSGSRVTWSSEPGYIGQNRYSAANTLMELRPGGTLKVGRWG